MTTKIAETISLSPVPVIKPKNEKQAALRAFLKFELSCISSPISAPTKGPNRMPMGFPVRSPANTPMVAPHEPSFEPPAFFVKTEGTKLFIISAARQTTAHTITVVRLMWEALQK